MTTTTATYTVANCLKMMGVEQLNNAKVIDSESYDGLTEYYHITGKDIAYPGSTSETSWVMLRLEFPTLAANGQWQVQIGLAYIRQAKGQKFVAVKPTADQNDKLAFKNLNTLPVDLQSLFEMGLLASDDKSVATVKEWLATGTDTLRLAAVDANSYLDISLAVRVAGKNAANYGTVPGALAKNPLGVNSYWGEGFTPVTAKARNVMGTKKPMVGKRVDLGVTVPSYPQPEIAPVAITTPIRSVDNSSMIKDLLACGVPLNDIVKQLMILAAETAAAAVTVTNSVLATETDDTEDVEINCF